MRSNIQRSKLTENISIAGKASLKLVSELQHIMARVNSCSELLQFMMEAGAEAPGLQDAWKLTEESVRDYYQSINHAVDRARKGAGTEPSFISSRFAQRSLLHKSFRLFLTLVRRANVRL